VLTLVDGAQWLVWMTVLNAKVTASTVRNVSARWVSSKKESLIAQVLKLLIVSACLLKCATCPDQKVCLTCRGDRINLPHCVCPDGLYDDNINTNCVSCDISCAKCTIKECSACNGNRHLEGGHCVCDDSGISYSDTYYCSNCKLAVVDALLADTLD
jgi:hypothetical protein